jgi:predicted Fe-Mo cluster-binding NifX family protein
MKIAVPVSNGTLYPHFGHCRQFAVLDADPETKTINSAEMLTPPPHEPGVLPAWLSEVGCSVIIAGGMGGRALEMFRRNGIEVVIGAPEGKPEEIVLGYLNGNLRTGANACDH